MSELNISFDEKKFKRLRNERDNWLLNGNEDVIKYDYINNNLIDVISPDSLNLVVKDIIDLNEEVAALVLGSVDGSPLPSFRAGQSISLTIKINGNFITRPYSLASNPNVSESGIYKIVVKRENNGVMSNYIIDSLKIGDVISSSSPYGDFYYNSIRDCNNITAIVNEMGIVPILSMAQAVLDGIDDYTLTIFYSAKYEKDIILKEELDDITSNTSRIKVHYVLSDEEVDGYEHGFVSLDKINNAMIDDITSFFIAGSEGMMKYLDKELEGLKLPRKFIRYQNFLPRCNIKKVQTYNLYLYINNEKYEIKCYNNKTIMKAIEESGVFINSKCHVGTCGFCRSELVKGKVKIINDNRRIEERNYNFIHPCVTYPLSDIEIIVR